MQNHRNCLAVVSNRSEKLLEALGENLFQGKPFAPKIVLVPTATQKNKILFFFAQKRRWGVCAGIQFYTIEQYLSAQRHPQGKRVLSKLELAFLIEHELLRALDNSEQYEVFLPVHRYLDAKNGTRSQRVTTLSHELSALFLKYGVYGEGFLDLWLKQGGWQQGIWKEIFSDQWSFPLELCREAMPSSDSLHLFGFSAIAPLFRSYFMKRGATFYLLSPSPLFLGDVCTDRELLFAEKGSERRGVKLAERQAFHSLVKETNRVIANFGKLKRNTLSLLDEDVGYVDERYEEPIPGTLLQQIQCDLYELKNPSEDVEVKEGDRSLEVHSVCSLRREVEVLRDHIVQRIAQGCPLSEMVVLAPHLHRYVPYIEALFGADEYPIPYTIRGASIQSDPFEKGFLYLLSLKESRFEREAVLKLFTFSPFIEKLGLDEEEAGRFCSWIRKSRLLWGYNEKHRQDALNEKNALSDSGTWEWAFDRLLWGLCAHTGGALPLSPLSEVSLTEAEILGKGIGGVRALKRCFEDIALKPNKSFSEWVDTFREIAQTFFLVSPESTPLFCELEKAKKKLESADGPLFCFESILFGVQQIVERNQGGNAVSNFEALSFLPLSEGNITEATCLFLLGLQEGDFPQAERLSPFRSPLFKGREPLVIDEQRNLFLEALMQAKEALVISYQNTSEEDGKEVQPSLFIQELFSYLDAGYICEGKRPSRALQMNHPISAFDDHESTAPAVFAGAIALYHAPQRELPSFLKARLSQEKRDEIVSIQDLLRCARHPIQFFLSKGLGMYFQWPQSGDEEFVLSPLQKIHLRKESLRHPLSDVIQRAEREGVFPLWQFGSLAKHGVIDELRDFHQALAHFGIDPQEIFEIELVDGLKEPRAVSRWHRLVPALEVKGGDGERFKIVGKLTELSPRGMVVNGKGSLEEMTKVWPAFLIYRMLEGESLLFTQEGKERRLALPNPDALLVKHLDYFMTCRRQLSLFMPKWAEEIIEGDEAALLKKMEATRKEVKRKRGDPYMQWFFMREQTCNVKPFYIEVVPKIREVMHGVI